MLTEVLLQAHKGLQETKLSGLRALTIFSGPNDSGKTTVLEAFCLGKTLRSGHDLSQRLGEIAKLLARTNSRLQRRVASPRAPVALREPSEAQWLDAVTRVTETRRIWYTGEAPQLVQSAVKQLARELRTGIAQDFVTEAGKALASFLPEAPTRLLIPAKRRLEEHAKLLPLGEIRPEGTGVVRHLSSLKNSPRDSPAHGRYRRIEEAFRMISAGYELDVTSADDSVQLQFSRDGEAWRKAGACGLGLHDLVLILYFCTHDYQVVAIEEPELHLHPDAQRRLLRYFEDLSSPQLLVSTHSSVFLSSSRASIRSTRFEDGRVQIEDVTSRANLLTDLGYSPADNLLADLVVLVEGPSDVPVLSELCRKAGVDRRGLIRFWPLGGNAMIQVDLSIVTEAYQTVAIIDKDPGSSKIREEFVQMCTEKGIAVTRLERYAIENYFTLNALRETLGERFPAHLKTIDPDQKLNEQLTFPLKKSENRRVVERMSFEDVRDTDLGAFVLGLGRLLDGTRSEATREDRP